ncbi:hypothetical protein JYT90_00985 [bacterium AH-315-P07]|nr:hypothetical protein [bacterium AH-315-P07]
MNAVGIISVEVGALFLIGRVGSLVAPAKFMAMFRSIVSTNTGLRMLGAHILVLGLAMIAAGYLQDSGLATVLFYLGIVFTGMSTFLLLLFPKAYRDMVDTIIPEDTSGVMLFIRFKSLTGVIIAGLFIYFGVQAL